MKEEGKLRVTEFVSVNDLANLMQVNVADVIKKCMELGIMVSINQRLDKDTITLVADEFGFEISFYAEVTEEEVVDGRGGQAGRSRPAPAGGHDHGPRRSREDIAARLHPAFERRGRRIGRDHAAHRRL